MILLLALQLLSAPVDPTLHDAVTQALNAEGIDLGLTRHELKFTQQEDGLRVELWDIGMGTAKSRMIKELPEDEGARVALLTVVVGDLFHAPVLPAASAEPEAVESEDVQVQDEQPWALFVQSQGLSERHYNLLERVLRRTLQSVAGLALAEPTTVTTGACPTAASACLAQLQDALGSGRAIVAQVLRINDTETLSLKLLNLESMEVITTALRPAVPGEGVLSVVEVAVQDVFPAAPPAWQPAADVTSRWNAKPVKPWLFWSAVGATVVATGATIGLGLWAKAASEEAQALVDGSLTGAVDGRAIIQADNKANNVVFSTNVALGSAAVFAAASVVLGLYTDFQGDVALDAAVGAQGAMLSVTGAF